MKSPIAVWLPLFLGCLAGCGGPKSTPAGQEDKTGPGNKAKTDPGKEAKADATGLDGMWTMVSQTSDGINVANEGANISFAGDKMTFHGQEPHTITIKVDTTKTPREINFMGHPDAPAGIPGIYEVNGDTLKIAMGLFHTVTHPINKKGEEPKKETIRTPRPKNFDDPKGAEVMILKRGGALLNSSEIKKRIVGKWHIGSSSSGSPIFGDVEFTADGKILRMEGKAEKVGTYTIDGQTLVCTMQRKDKNGKTVENKVDVEIRDVTDAELKAALFSARRIK